MGTMKCIAIECLTCGHCTSIPEKRLKAFRLSPDAPIAKFIRRLTLLRVRRSQRAGLSLRSSRRGLMFVHFGSEADTSSLDKIALSAWGITVSVEHLST